MTRDTAGTNSVFNSDSFGEVVMSEMEKQSQQYSPRMLFFSSVIIISIIQQRLAPIFKNISILHISIEEKVKQAINQFMDIFKNKNSVIDVLRNSNIYDNVNKMFMIRLSTCLSLINFVIEFLINLSKLQ
jgi:hypothetical protein